MRLKAALAALAVLTATLAFAQPGSAQPPERIYQVTIENLTGGQPFTPALVATHKGSDDFFTVGSEARIGIVEIAENGNLDPLVARVSSDTDFFAHVVKPGETGVPPVVPGETVSFEIAAAPPYNFLSWASMLICTNDGFTGVDKVKLPTHVGQAVTLQTQGYDAGTEINTELFADIVPPCGPLTGQDSMGQGTGMSDDSLTEGGVITHHGGIVGDADLDASINDWTNPVASITIERVG